MIIKWYLNIEGPRRRTMKGTRGEISIPDFRMVHGDNNGDDDGEDVNPSPSYEAQHVNMSCNTLVSPPGLSTKMLDCLPFYMKGSIPRRVTIGI